MARRKTCNGCRAIYIEQCGHPHCECGFKIVRKNTTAKMGNQTIPMSNYYPEDPNCPKPKTYMDLINYNTNRRYQ